MDEQERLSPDVLQAWRVEEAPASIEDRVWRRTVAQNRMRRWSFVAGTAAVAAAAAAVLLATRGPVARHSGPLVAVERTTWPVADRAVAVAEHGSRLTWAMDATGAVVVQQTRGDVFYRIDPGTRFEVVSPAGSVRALGTCFRVEVRTVKNKSKVLVAGAASALTATAIITVYEGRAALSDERTLGPGETAVLVAPTLGDQTAIDTATASAERRMQKRLQVQAAEIRALQDALVEARRAPPPSPVNAPPPSGQWKDDNLAERFDEETRDDQWATANEALLKNRLVRYTKIADDKLSVECRQHCCDVQLALDAGESMRTAIVDLKSDVGVGIGHTGWNDLDVRGPQSSNDGLGHIYVCNSRASSDSSDGEDQVDRGLERERLLARAAPALEACRRSLRGPLEVTVSLTVDVQGAISGVRTSAVPVGEPATKCVEQALLSVAEFAPAPRVTWFPVRVVLDGSLAPAQPDRGR